MRKDLALCCLRVHHYLNPAQLSYAYCHFCWHGDSEGISMKLLLSVVHWMQLRSPPPPSVNMAECPNTVVPAPAMPGKCPTHPYFQFQTYMYYYILACAHACTHMHACACARTHKRTLA